VTAALPTVTVAEPVVGSALGVVVPGETLDTHRSGYLALALALARSSR
jgi:hypothetical protein